MNSKELTEKTFAIATEEIAAACNRFYARCQAELDLKFDSTTDRFWASQTWLKTTHAYLQNCIQAAMQANPDDETMEELLQQINHLSQQYKMGEMDP